MKLQDKKYCPYEKIRHTYQSRQVQIPEYFWYNDSKTNVKDPVRSSTHIVPGKKLPKLEKNTRHDVSQLNKQIPQKKIYN